MSTSYTIGRVAEMSGVPAKTIRYYEDVRLLPPARRSGNGYRVYDDRSVHVLRFIHRARGLGFSIKEVEDLLQLWHDKRRKSASVKALAQGHIAAIEQKLSELEAMRATLQTLVDRCHGDHRPDCPILDDLAGEHHG
jgi:MerR family copper efflux transcriptional regulator